MGKKILAIIPVYNEDQSIGNVIDGIRKYTPQIDIVVVNDGSTDRSAQVVRSKGVVLLNLPYNLGIGSTMQTGYIYALRNNYDIAIQVDGDGQHPPKEINKLIKALEEGMVDIIIGSRYKNKNKDSCYRSTFARILGNKLLSTILSPIVGQKITDSTSGFRAANKDVIMYFSNRYPDDYPEVEALFLLHWSGFKIKEIPIEMKKRETGITSINSWKSFYYMIKVMLAIFVGLLRKKVKGKY